METKYKIGGKKNFCKIPKKAGKKEKILAISVSLFLVVGLLWLDGQLIFNPGTLQKITQKKLTNLFGEPVKIRGFHFDFSKNLSVQAISVSKKNLYRCHFAGVTVYHHPFLAYLGIYYPQRMEIKKAEMEVFQPKWRPAKICKALQVLFLGLKKIPQVHITRLTLQVGAGEIFEEKKTFFFNHLSLQSNATGFILEGAQNMLHNKQKGHSSLPWEGMETRLDYRSNPPSFQASLKLYNFFLKEKSRTFFPRKWSGFLKKEKIEGIFDIQGQYNFSLPRQSHFTGRVRGYNLKMPFLKKELTNGEIFINLRGEDVEIPFFRGILSKREFLWRGLCLVGPEKTILKGRFLKPHLRDVSFSKGGLNNLKIFFAKEIAHEP